MKNNQNKTSVVMKTDSSENWAKCEEKYIPAPYTIIVYQDEDKQPKMKISDGVTTLKDLQFINFIVNTPLDTSAPIVEGSVLKWS